MVRSRLTLLAAGYAALLVAFLARLVHLQVVRGDELSERATANRRQVELLRAPRGSILDRRGRPLAVDSFAYDLAATPALCDPGGAAALLAARTTGLPATDLARRLREIARGAGADAEEAPLVCGLDAALTRRLARSVRAVPGVRVVRAGAGNEGSLLVTREATRRAGRALAALAEGSPDLAPRLREALAGAFDWASEASDPRALLAERVEVARDVGFEEAARILEENLSGVDVLTRLVRDYPQGARAAHVAGYTGVVSPDEARDLRASGRLIPWGYDPTPEEFDAARSSLVFPDDRIGRSGVEALCQGILAGVPGARWTECDRRGGHAVLVREVLPQPGRSISVTIDLDIQAAAEDALDRAIAASGTGRGGGAAVLLDLATGDLLALATAPRYDPARLHSDYATLAAARPSPLLFRAVAGAVPPGSTMKLVTASALLTDGPAALDGRPFDPSTREYCRGYLVRPGQFQCWNHAGHGPIDVRRALTVSCNIFFYRGGEALGAEGLARWAGLFGLGRPTGLGLGEVAGRVPTPAWRAERADAAAALLAEREAALAVAAGRWPLDADYLARLGQAAREIRRARDWARRTADDRAWTRGTSRNVAVGQGDLAATPLQIARVAAAVAQDGRMPVPRIVPDGPPRFEEVPVSAEALRVIRDAMRAVVATPEGTASRSSIGLAGLDVAAKTGTAQAPGGNHAWIAGYYPATGTPRVAFSVLVEHVRASAHGGDVAGPVAAAIIRAYRTSGAENPSPPSPLPVGEGGG